MQHLQRVIERIGVEIDQVVVTHWHRDHIGGAPAIIRRTKATTGRELKLYKIPLVPGVPCPA